MNTLRSHKGQTLVEFAFLIPILILVITLFIDVGRLIYTYSEMSNATREGTRYAIVRAWNNTTYKEDIRGVVRKYSPGLDTNTSIYVIDVTDPVAGTDIVTIKATYAYKPITPGLQLIIGNGNVITIKAQSSAMVSPFYRNY
jgi:Flp pilus assembly protein TadG